MFSANGSTGFRMLTHKQRNGQPIDEAAYAESLFRAARQPVRSFVMIWASTRLLWITSVLWKMQAVITPAQSFINCELFLLFVQFHGSFSVGKTFTVKSLSYRNHLKKAEY